MKLATALTRRFGSVMRKFNPDRHFQKKRVDTTSESYAFLGKVFEVAQLAQREPREDLQNEVVRKAFEFFSTVQASNFKLTEKDYPKAKLNSWGVYDIDLVDHFEELLLHLRVSVVNRNTRVRINLEREYRRMNEKELCVHEYRNKPIEHFMKDYAALLEMFDEKFLNTSACEISGISEESVRDLLEISGDDEVSAIQIDENRQTRTNTLMAWIHS